VASRRFRHRIYRIHRSGDGRRGASKGGRKMTTEIAIIGAGCAGLGAATTLVEQNDADVSVMLIEANDWIGGRARTDPNLPVDLGPQYIQDPKYNPWARIAEKGGYGHEAPVMDTQYRMLVNGLWTTVEYDRDIDQMNETLSLSYEAATGFRNAPILMPGMGVYGAPQVVKLALGSNTLGAIGESAEPSQFIARDRYRQVEVPYENNWYVAGGLGKMVSEYGSWLLGQYGQNLKITQECVVTDIREKNGKVSLWSNEEPVGDFDYCILTVPCSEVLKINFEPHLSGIRVRADDYIRLGSYKKVAFVPTAVPTAKGNDIIPHCEYFIYDQLNDGVWEYFLLPAQPTQPTQPTILVCVTAGDFALRLDGVPEDDVVQSVVDLLTEAYASGGGDFTPQSQPVVTNWTDTPYIGGAYSYTRFDLDLDLDNPVPLKARKEIAKPHGRVHFAGEATWWKAYGTIHGAYKSGERAANEILKAIRKSSD
jgi:monoamine oxidase